MLLEKQIMIFFLKNKLILWSLMTKKVMETGIAILIRWKGPRGRICSRHVVSTTKLPRKDSRDQIVGIMGITRDITLRALENEQYIKEQKRIEEDLRELNMALANAMPGISRLDINGHYIYINQLYGAHGL